MIADSCEYKPVVDCGGILHVMHDEIIRTDFIADCLRGLSVANGQNFDFPIDLHRCPYKTVTLHCRVRDITECVCSTCVCFCFLFVISLFVHKNQWRDVVYFQLNRFGRNGHQIYRARK